MSLITPQEVIMYSPAGNDYPTKVLCDLIRDVEEDLMNKCLGVELYEYMISKLNPYPADAEEWNAEGSYDEDEYAIRNGCLFVSLIDDNTSDPGEEDNVTWELFERFSDPGVRDLWVYVRRIIALQVYHDSLTKTTWRAGRNGVAVHQTSGGNDGWRSGNKGEIIGVKTDVRHDIDRITDNMVVWLRRYGEEKNLPLAKACGSKICGTKRRARGHRFMFRN